MFSEGEKKLVNCSEEGTLLQWDVPNGTLIGKSIACKWVALFGFEFKW